MKALQVLSPVSQYSLVQSAFDLHFPVAQIAPMHISPATEHCESSKQASPVFASSALQTAVGVSLVIVVSQ